MVVKILYVNGGPMNRGGIEAFMMNYVRHMNSNMIHIDFAVTGLEKGDYDEIIRFAARYRYPSKYRSG